MNLLIVSTRPPLPAVKGDQVVLFNRIRELSRRGHRVFLCFLHASDRELRESAAIGQYCAGVFPHRLSTWQRLLNLARFGPFSSVPLQVLLYRDPGLKQLVSEIVAREEIDLIDAFLIRSYLAVEGQACPVVVDLVDSMFLNLKGRYETDAPWLRPVLSLELARVGRFERQVCERVAASVVVSARDQETIGAARVRCIPLGVDEQEFHPAGDEPIRGRIVFSGNMRYHANRAALAWFIRGCWPALHASLPDAELCVVGAESEGLRSDYSGIPGLRIVGTVPSMGDFLRTADVSIAPMRSGSGMQNKVLQAMACGVPTVVSRFGLGDIRATNGVHTLVADTEPEFVDSVRRLVRDRPLRAAVAAAGLELVGAEHSWARAAAEFERVASASIASAPGGPAAPGSRAASA